MDRAIRVENKGPNDPTLSLSLAEPPFISSLSISSRLVDEDLVDPTRTKYPVLVAGNGGLLLFAVARKRDPYSERERKPNSFCHRTQQDSLVLCNPITHQWLELPKPPELLNDRRAIGLATRAGPGLVSIFVVTEYQPIIGSESAYLMTFSSETGKWETKSANYMLGMHIWRPGGVIEFDGHLFWIDVSCGLIVWDDPFSSEKKVQCGFIPLPQGCYRRFDTPGLEDERSVGVSGGHIQYLEVADGGFLRLWRLKDYRRGEWGLVHKVCLKDLWADESYLAYGLLKVKPVKLNILHPFEEDVVFFVMGDRIFEVNIGKKKVLSCGVYSSLMNVDLPFVLPRWPSSFPPLLLASLAKDRGNEYFKEKNFSEAIDSYSTSIHHSPTAQAFANRAAAYLKMCKYLQAENDCTEALKLDGEYMKAYGRRAIAKKELGKLKEAKEDAELCLKLDPSQNDIQKLLVELNSLLEKETIKGDGEDGIVLDM